MSNKEEKEDRYKRLARIMGLVSYRPKPKETGEKPQDKTMQKTEEKYINLDELTTPTSAKIGKMKVSIIEIHKLNLPFKKEYIVALSLIDGNWKSPIFHLHVKNAKDLIEKIKTEIERYLILKHTVGREVIKPL